MELKNLVFGDKYLYFKGTLRVTNLSNGYVLEIKYPGMGWTGSKDYKVKGYVYDD